MNTGKSRSAESGEKGIALIMVLWVLTVLMVIVLAFSYMGRTEILITQCIEITVDPEMQKIDFF